MILAVDVGNTQTVIGLIKDGVLDGHWRVSTDSGLTADELRVKIGSLLAAEDHSWADIDRAIVASVVPNLTAEYEKMSLRATGVVPFIVGPGIKTGIDIRYENPREVGADRIVNAVAAYRLYGGPVVVVDFGTATTIDVIAEDGGYLGGAIAAGIETSADALFSRAARLSKVDLEPPDKVIGTNTRTSIQAGLLLGEAAMVDGLVTRVWNELGRKASVVATGGLAQLMAPLCETVDEVDPDLTLKGLAYVYELNTDAEA